MEKDSGISSSEKASKSAACSTKGKSKVWRKVTKLTRRARSRRRSLPVATDEFCQHEAAARLSRTPSPERLLSWSESSSLSEEECFTGGGGGGGGRAEVLEQSCLRPSVTRALFKQLDDQRMCFPSSIPRTLSVPNDISNSKPCHCNACCSCSPQRSLHPAISLDRGLDRLVPDGINYYNMKGSSEVVEIGSTTFDAVHEGRCHSLPNYRPQPPTSSDKPMSAISAAVHTQLCHGYTSDMMPKWHEDEVAPSEFRTKLTTIKNWFADFSDEQKNLILTELLQHCSVPQIHHLSVEIEPRLHYGCPPNCCDRFSWLPYNLSLHILSFLDAESLHSASAVSCSWHRLASEPSLWRRLCGHSKWKLSCAGEQKQLIQHMMPNGTVNWKKVFSERFRLRNNWLMGKCNVRTFEGHTQGISCVQFDDTRIVSGSSDKTIKVWNIRTNSPWSVQTLVGHSGTVRCLFLDSNRLVSGSTDMTIKVWDLSTQQSWSSIACKVTMTGHLDTVRCLQVDEDKVISGSYDKTLKVWDIRTGVCLRTLRGHSAAVLCLQFDNAKIVSGSCDKTIKLWTVEGECVRTLAGHQDAVTCLQFDETRIVSGSLDCTIRFWCIQTGDCANTIDWKASEGHTGVVRCLQSDSWRVVSASDDRTIKVWSLESGKRLVTLWNHTDGVTCLQFNDSIIVSGSYDKTVKLWDFSC